MKVVSIGSNGLLSSALGHFCEKNNHSLIVYGLDAPKYTCDSFIPCNLLEPGQDFDACRDAGLVVYASGAGIQSHLHEKADLVYGLNVSAPIMLTNRLAGLGFSGIFASFGSYFEIGENADCKHWTENDIIRSTLPVPNDYCISKRMLTRYAGSVDLPYTYWHFILPTIYAEYESPFRLIPMTVSNLLRDIDNNYTAGDQVRQYLYIDRVIENMFAALQSRAPSGIYNMEGEETFSVRELVEKIYSFFGKPFEKAHFGQAQRADTGMKDLRLDGHRLNAMIPAMPSVLLETILPKYEQVLNGMNR